MNITPDMAWLRTRDDKGNLPPPPTEVDIKKLERNGWCRQVDGRWVVTDAAAWALSQGVERAVAEAKRVRQEIKGEH